MSETPEFPGAIPTFTDLNNSHADPGDDGSATDLVRQLNKLHAEIVEIAQKMGIDGSADTTSFDFLIADAVTDVAALQVDTHDDQHAMGGGSHLGQATFVQLPAIFSRLSADYVHTVSNTTLANTGLSFALDANSTYVFLGDLFTDGATAGDIKLALTLASGSITALKWAGVGGDVTTVTTVSQKFASGSGTTMSFGTAGSGTTTSVRASGTARTGAAVTLNLQAAQDTSSGTASKVLTDSWMMWWKVV